MRRMKQFETHMWLTAWTVTAQAEGPPCAGLLCVWENVEGPIGNAYKSRSGRATWFWHIMLAVMRLQLGSMFYHSSPAFARTTYHCMAARALTPDSPAADDTPATDLASPAAPLALPGGKLKPHQPRLYPKPMPLQLCKPLTLQTCIDV